jgi:hypothetical protein
MGVNQNRSVLTPAMLRRCGLVFIGLWLSLGIVQLARGWWMIDSEGMPLGSNFLWLWASGRLAMAGHAAASYDWQAIGSIELGAVAPGQTMVPWLYPPTFLLAAVPFGLLPYLWSCGAWLLLTGIGYLAAIRAILPHRLTMLLALAAPPVFINVIETETGFAVAGLAGMALLHLETRPILAGVALGFLTFKPQLGLLFPLVLMASGRWRAFFSAAATAILLGALAAFLFGADIWGVFLRSIPATLSADVDGGFVAWKDVQTWNSLASYLGASRSVAWTVFALSAGVSATAICRLWRKPVSYNLKAAAVAVGTFLVTPYVMSYDMVLLAVAVAFLVRENLATELRQADVAVYALVLFMPLYPMAADGIVPLLPATNTILLGWILYRSRRTDGLPTVGGHSAVLSGRR